MAVPAPSSHMMRRESAIAGRAISQPVATVASRAAEQVCIARSRLPASPGLMW